MSFSVHTFSARCICILDTTDDMLQEFYGKWGEIVDCIVMRDSATGRYQNIKINFFRLTPKFSKFYVFYDINIL